MRAGRNLHDEGFVILRSFPLFAVDQHFGIGRLYTNRNRAEVRIAAHGIVLRRVVARLDGSSSLPVASAGARRWCTGTRNRTLVSGFTRTKEFHRVADTEGTAVLQKDTLGGRAVTRQVERDIVAARLETKSLEHTIEVVYLACVIAVHVNLRLTRSDLQPEGGGFLIVITAVPIAIGTVPAARIRIPPRVIEGS
jgi:hypothetical protein